MKSKIIPLTSDFFHTDVHIEIEKIADCLMNRIDGHERVFVIAQTGGIAPSDPPVTAQSKSATAHASLNGRTAAISVILSGGCPIEDHWQALTGILRFDSTFPKS
jgi:hypothetical protein